jgi:Protein of unknown function (DUF3828)
MSNRVIAFLLSGVLFACTAETPKTETQPAAAPATATATATAPAPPPAPSAADAEKLVADLYAEHAADRGPFFQTEDRARLDRFFVPELADLIWKDVVASQGEVGALDFDPLYNAQDFEVKNLAVKADPPAGTSANVVVTFENFGTKEEIRYSLTAVGGGWKITDVTYGEGRTLRDVYQTQGS